ncbi:MAG: hypothetical protein NWE88_00540 [Candidatus Bathyarchaeota archaeon]|nr:hypothetical protein [Candidatus Bathyarchaeota archaeon]
MVDIIDDLISAHKFNETLEDRSKCENVILYIYHVWSSFAGQDVKPPSDVIRRMLLVLLRISHNYQWVLMAENKEMAERVIERVADQMSTIGHEEAEGNRSISYAL